MMKVWELLVPSHDDEIAFSIEHHQIWDRRVCEMIGGLTLYPTVKGRWTAKAGVFLEPMIPVKLACTDEQIEAVLKFTGEHYKQDEIIAWVVADEVKIWRSTE